MNFRKFSRTFFNDVIYRDTSYLLSTEELRIKNFKTSELYFILTESFSVINFESLIIVISKFD